MKGKMKATRSELFKKILSLFGNIKYRVFLFLTLSVLVLIPSFFVNRYADYYYYEYFGLGYCQNHLCPIAEIFTIIALVMSYLTLPISVLLLSVSISIIGIEILYLKGFSKIRNILSFPAMKKLMGREKEEEFLPNIIYYVAWISLFYLFTKLLSKIIFP